MRIALLGPMEVTDDAGRPVSLPGVRLRRLVTRLALDPGRPISAAVLVDAVWGDEVPDGAAHALQSLVSRLRRALPAEDAAKVQRVAAGYRLAVAGESIDIGQFERFVGEGRLAGARGDAQAAEASLARALALWRGAPLADLAQDPAATRLAELQLQALEEWAAARLELGAEVLVELEAALAAHPRRERLHELRLRALAGAGRRAEALAAYEDLRRELAESLGADPSPALRDLHVRLLREEPPPIVRTNVRPALTSFVGRVAEAERVGERLEHARLVTLVGPGGAGKTRLATEVAARQLDRVRDGVWLVELAAIREAAEIAPAIADALGLREVSVLGGAAPTTGGPRGPVDRLVDGLHEWDVLILLDNCEHLIAACARIADRLLRECRGVRVLATSREPLAITGESLCPVGPLALPAETMHIGDVEEIESVRLFVDRAAAVRPGFAVTAENRGAVVELCRRLDGLPLAIELACARLRTLPLDELSARLGDRFRLLTGGSRTALPRHRTLLAVVEWSWDLLNDAERVLARRIAVFPAGATAEAVEAVCAGGILPRADVLEVLGGLVDKSFVLLAEEPGAPARYRMLDTVAAFCIDALSASGEADDVRRAHARFMLEQAELAEPALRGPDQLRWLDWLGREEAGTAAAVRWAIDSSDVDMAVRLVAAMGWFWRLRSAYVEAADWSREALDLPGLEAVPADTVAIAYAFDALHHYAFDELDRANASVERARSLAVGPAMHPACLMVDIILLMQRFDVAAATARLAELADYDDPWIAAVVHLLWGHAAEHFGDVGAATQHFIQARDRFRIVGDRWGVATAIGSLGGNLSVGGDHAAAIDALDEGVRLAEAVGALDDAARLQIWRGRERLRSGDPAGARAELEQARAAGVSRRSLLVTSFAEASLAEVDRQAGNLAAARASLTDVLIRVDEAKELPPQLRAQVLTSSARLAVVEGDLPLAGTQLAEALEIGLVTGDRPIVAGVADAMAELALGRGDAETAARRLGLAAATRGAADLGSPDVRRTAAAARAILGPAFDGHYEDAAALDVAAATAALRGAAA